MIIRIVKMEFKKEYVNQFLTIFNNNKKKIQSFQGCESLKLFEDINNKNSYFTHSIWKSEYHLNKYRDSETFKLIWAQTKPLFINKAKAWSLEEI